MRYFFHIFDGVVLRDPTGIEITDAVELHDQVMIVAGHLLRAAARSKMWSGAEWVVSVRDADDVVVFNLRVTAKTS